MLEVSRNLWVEDDISLDTFGSAHGISDTATGASISSDRHGNSLKVNGPMSRCWIKIIRYKCELTGLYQLKGLFFGHVWPVVGIKVAHWVNATGSTDVDLLADNHAAQGHNVDLSTLDLVPASHDDGCHELATVVVDDRLGEMSGGVNLWLLASLHLVKLQVVLHKISDGLSVGG